MLMNRRELLKATALGASSLALTPSFNHLMGTQAHAGTSGAGGLPHRFIFIRKSNGNLTKQFGLPSFSPEELKKHERDELKVRAGLDGVLQLVPVDVGQQVAPGTNLARVADPSRLKAEIKVAETQAKDVQIGQAAQVDTRNGIVNGKVIRIDPSVQNGTRTVDVSLDGELPKGAVPDLSVDGTIELERLANVLFMGRPAFGQDQSTVGIFKVAK